MHPNWETDTALSGLVPPKHLCGLLYYLDSGCCCARIVNNLFWQISFEKKRLTLPHPETRYENEIAWAAPQT
jgi:hypothetical protein